MKKIISIVLCIAMVFTLTVPAFAAETKTEKCPIIYVPGIDSSTIYADKDNPDETVEIPGKEKLVEIIKNDILPAFVVYWATGDVDKLAMTITGALNEGFKLWFNNPDGTPVGNSGVINNYPAVSAIGENSKFTFSYDWRGDPMVVAAELNDYINYITENSKYDKVALSSHSLGSVVILTYLTVYGDDKVMGWVMDSPALEGISYVGDLLCGELELTSEGILTFLKGYLGETEYEDLVSSSFDILEMAGLSELIIGNFNDAVKKIAPILYSETLMPIFGSWLTIWAMVPEERFDEAVEYAFENFSKGKDLSVLRGKIEDYNNTVRKNRKATLLEFDEAARVAVISKYGYTCVPVAPSWALAGDGVIETQSTSLGATVAPFGDYFSDEYLEGKDMKYISPDKTIDASTCLFPEKTWFIKNILHEEVRYTEKLFAQFLFSEEELTCENSELARFTLFDRETKTIITDETEPQKIEKPTPFERLFNFLKALFEKLISFFKKAE